MSHFGMEIHNQNSGFYFHHPLKNVSPLSADPHRRNPDTQPIKRIRTLYPPLPCGHNFNRNFQTQIPNSISLPQFAVNPNHQNQTQFANSNPKQFANSNPNPKINHDENLVPQQLGNSISGLIESLVEKGLIKITKFQEIPVEDSMGLDFDPAKLKIRHESVVRSLYTDIPRQCTACGMRFKRQEDHSQHMDWHLRKNRAAKKPQLFVSRKWFVDQKLWLSAVTASETMPVPAFWRNDKEETAEVVVEVVAEEVEEKECALCMEEFEEYFSSERNQWMYRGAVYLNEKNCSTKNLLHTSLFGRLVHAKCI